MVVKSEKDLIRAFIYLVFKIDPDIITGYYIERKSLYYLVKRVKNNNKILNNFF